MNNSISNPKALLECDLVVLAQFFDFIKKAGFENFEEYFQFTMDESAKNELITLSKMDISQIINYLSEYLLDGDSSWTDNFNPFKSTNSFTFVYLYKSAQKNDENFPFADWNLISRHSKITLGKEFKEFVQKTEEIAEKDEWYIKKDGLNMSSAALYKLIQK